MSYDKAGFRDYFASEGAGPNTLNTYNSFLGRIDKALDGLDEAIRAQGSEQLMSWSGVTDAEPFTTYRSHARSVLKRYLQFRLQGLAGGDEVEMDSDQTALLPHSPSDFDANFKIEKEMQQQVRKQIGQIETGLEVIDGGSETQVATGFIDILARDSAGRVVVIELKAGKCPAGALEQVCAYAQDVSEERGGPVRAILIAGSFTDRVRAASKWCGNVELMTYAYNLSFSTAEA
ncbi:endonuclease NucS domain-containing protein [Sphingomonas koreensis]